MIAETKATYHIEEEEQLRANMYELIGGVLRAEPNNDIINNIAKLDGDDSEMGRALSLIHI